MDTQDQRWAAATRMLATHLISIVGVAIASQRSLAVSLIHAVDVSRLTTQTYLAVSSLPRPAFVSSITTEPEPVSAGVSTVKAFVQRPRVRKALVVVGGILTGLAIWGLVTGVIMAMFRFASQLVLDSFFTLLMGAGISACLYEVRCSLDHMTKANE